MPRRAALLPLILLQLTPPLSAAAPPPPTSPPHLSATLSTHLAASLPKYLPPPAPTAPVAVEPPKDETPTDGDVVSLPKFFVEDTRLSQLDPDKLLSPRALAAKMRRDYRKSLGDLEWALNCFNIPFLTPSVAARARANYDDRKLAAEMTRLGDLVDVARRLDPKAAAELQRELTKR